MRSFEVVTTFSAAGFREYGARMVNSFRQFWPADVPLTIYSENMPDGGGRPLPAWQAEFKSRNAGRRERGQTGKGYNFRFDAIKFSHKVAAVTDAYRETKADVLIWLDADTISHAPVTADFLESLLPPEAQIAWLDRLKLYPECGFVMFRAKDPGVRGAMREFADLYESGRVFELPEWHDSFALEHVVKSAGLAVASLSGAAAGTMHPFVNSPLGAVMDHLKGPRKGEGRSRQTDLSGKRGEAYWQGGGR